MNGKIKVIEGVYPVSVDEAIYLTGSNKTLKDKLNEMSVGSVEFANCIKKIHESTSNLFNKDTVELYGYYDLNNGGAWYDDVNMVSSDFIPIEPSSKYIRSTSTGIINTFYTSDKNFISGNRSGNFTTPSNAYYMKMAVKTDTIETEMLVKGSVLPNSYEPYRPTPVFEVPSVSFNVELDKNYIVENMLSEELKAKISISDDERFEKAIPKVPLHIETYYDGANEPYHPSVVKFETEWNGYKYWMAYTPFPNEANENPCIACSNDLIKWVTPSGLTNPLDTPVSGGYWSDTHLVYNSNTNKLECWYRGVGASASGVNNICRKTSSDGTTWSNREVLFTFTSGSYVSPSIIFEDNKYKIWFCRPNERYESDDGNNWVKIGNYSFFPIDYKFWHQDIIKTDEGYELVGMEEVGKNTRIIHFTSTDGVKFKFGKEIVKVLYNNKYGIKGFYKPCLVKENGLYYLFLSINWDNGTNGMSLSIGDKINDITSIKGINQDYIPYMAKYTKKGKSGFEGQVIFDKSLNKMVYCKKGGRNAVWVDFNGNTV